MNVMKHRPLAVRRNFPALDQQIQGVGAVVGEDTAMGLSWLVSAGLLGAGVYVGLKGNFLTGGLLAIASVPAGLATRIVLAGPSGEST